MPDLTCLRHCKNFKKKISVREETRFHLNLNITVAMATGGPGAAKSIYIFISKYLVESEKYARRQPGRGTLPSLLLVPDED